MKKLAMIAALLVSIGASTEVFAQAACEQLSGAIENSMKEMSFFAAGGYLDNNAPRTTNRRLAQLVQVELIQSNLALMQANKCAMPKMPISEKAYLSSAHACVLAAEKQTGDGKVAECDRDTWVRK